MLRLKVAGRAGEAHNVGSTADNARARFAGVTSKPWNVNTTFLIREPLEHCFTLYLSQ